MAFYFRSVFLAMLVGFVLTSFAPHELHSFNPSIKEFLMSSHGESLQLVDGAIHLPKNRPRISSDLIQLFTFHRQAEPETQEICRAAEIFHSTLKLLKEKVKQSYKRNVTLSEILSHEDIKAISVLCHCPAAHPINCEHSYFSNYRTISGACNNRDNPRYGAANTAFQRWLPAKYDDGECEPKGWDRKRLHNGYKLPSPRKVSTYIVRSACKYPDLYYTQMLVEWGQYLDHDITFTPQTSGSKFFGTDCLNTCEDIHPCYPIETEDEACGEHGCMAFFRSLADCHIDPGYDTKQAAVRQQINALSSFIDASAVYGNTPKLQSFLRDLCGLNGKLAINTQFKDPKGRPYLPFVAKLPSACLQDPHDVHDARVECFSAGDSRVNEGLPLMSLHTLFLREHNRMAEVLKHLNPHWTPEMIFQEARKIMGALHQIVTLRDYIPKILGPDAFEEYIGAYSGYDPKVNPSIANVFAAAAFRFAHGTISSVIRRLDKNYKEHELYPDMRLHVTFFRPHRMVKEGGIEPIIRGVIGSKASAFKPGMMLTEEVTERLHILKLAHLSDLAALNIQRGRDHGLPGYNDWRAFCGLPPIYTLDELKDVVGDYTVAEKILDTYKHLDNVDVWLGGLVEQPLPGARVGPLFACLIGRQMKAIRDGDRLWWEAQGVFTPQQKDELVKFSISRLICDNSDIKEVPLDAFIYGGYPSGFVSCDYVQSVNLEAWREEKSIEMQRCGSPGTIANGDYVLSSTSGTLVALYTCYYGFKLQGADVLYCDGYRWSGYPPQCIGSYH